MREQDRFIMFSSYIFWAGLLTRINTDNSVIYPVNYVLDTCLGRVNDCDWASLVHIQHAGRVHWALLLWLVFCAVKLYLSLWNCHHITFVYVLPIITVWPHVSLSRSFFSCIHIKVSAQQLKHWFPPPPPLPALRVWRSIQGHVQHSLYCNNDKEKQRA